MIDLKKAQNTILEATPVLGHESVPILDALHRVLAQDVIAAEDLPAIDISAMDGYAVRHTSLRAASVENPVRLRIIGESPAGDPCRAIVGEGEAVRIMTGGVVPEGADSVVKNEDAAEENGYVICKNAPEPGDAIRLRGDSLRKGMLVLHAGDVIGPLEVGALASLRRAYAFVHRKPTVAILATGNELADFHEPPSAHKAMCSNLYALAAQVLDAGAIPLSLGIVKDDLKAQQTVLNEALRADVIITSGGTSRGKYDLVHKAFSSMGMDIRFSNFFSKPGKPSTVGTVGSSLIFGLPGNPSAAMLSFEQLIKPALLKMMGYRDLFGTLTNPAYEKKKMDPFSRIDSFNYEHGGNKDHLRASQFPLNSPFPEEDGLQHQYPASATMAGRLKMVGK